MLKLRKAAVSAARPAGLPQYLGGQQLGHQLGPAVARALPQRAAVRVGGAVAQQHLHYLRVLGAGRQRQRRPGPVA